MAVFDGPVTWSGLMAGLMSVLGILGVPILAGLMSYGGQLERLTNDEHETRLLEERVTVLRQRFEDVAALTQRNTDVLARYVSVGVRITDKFDSVDAAIAQLRVAIGQIETEMHYIKTERKFMVAPPPP